MQLKRNFFYIFSYILPLRMLVYIKNKFQIIRKMDYLKSNIYLDVDSEVEYKFRLKSCFHEPETVKWIEYNLKNGNTFFDIGANIGAYSLIAAKYNNNCKIYSFEPNFLSYNKLCNNIILNGCKDNIFAFNIALSNKYKLNNFNYFDFEIGSAYHTLGSENIIANIPLVYKQTIITYTIDKFIEDFNVESPNYIKIDVDGTELDILEGAYNTIMNPNFKSLIVEIDENSENCEKIKDYIDKLGLKFIKKYTDPNADDPIECNYKIYNYVFDR